MGKLFYKIGTAYAKIGGKFATYDPDAVPWYKLTESDVTGGYSAYHKKYFVSAINTGAEHPNIIFPSMLSGYSVNWNVSAGNFNPNIRKIRFESASSVGNITISGTTANHNTTLKGIYGVPQVGALTIQYNDALEEIDLSTMTDLASVLIAYNPSLKSVPQIPKTVSLTSLYNALWRNASAVNDTYVIPDNVTKADHVFMYNAISSFRVNNSWQGVTSWSSALDNNPLENLYFDDDVTNTIDTAWAGGEIGGATWFDYIKTTRSGNILKGSAYVNDPVTVHCSYGTVIYNKLRYAQASQNYMMRNLRLDLVDKHPIKQISFWGDSLTRRNESTSVQSNMVEHFYNWTADDVWCWNEGHGGASSWMFNKDYGSQEARWGDDVHVIWIGTNDTTLTEAQTIENIQTMISTCGFHDNYIVLQPFGWGYAEGNEALYEQAFPGITINTHRYIIEHGFEVLGREPTATEQEQLDNNTIPDVFVDTSDMTHITDSGGLCIATAVRDKLLALGYIDSTWLASS